MSVGIGSVIQIPSLEKGDRVVVEEPALNLPLLVPVTYAGPEGVVTVRFLNLEELPDDLRSKCERYLRDVMD